MGEPFAIRIADLQDHLRILLAQCGIQNQPLGLDGEVLRQQPLELLP